jgi:hypothetical protein
MASAVPENFKKIVSKFKRLSIVIAFFSKKFYKNFLKRFSGIPPGNNAIQNWDQIHKEKNVNL